MKTNKFPLVNWSPGDDLESFLDTDEWPKYSCRKSEYRLLDREKDLDLINFVFSRTEKMGSIGLYLDLWDLHLIEKIEVATLLKPVHLRLNENEIIYNYFDIVDKIEEMKFLSSDKPLKVYLSHYLPELVEAWIYPLVKYYPRDGDYTFFMSGYVAWQISKIYEEIFEKDYDNDGSSKDDLSFFQLTHLYVIGENEITINLDS